MNSSFSLTIFISWLVYGLAFRITTNNGCRVRTILLLSSEGGDEQQVVQDLNLEEMFEVFDAADKDKVLKGMPKKPSGKRKGEQQPRFDPAKAVGVELPMGFFGTR